VGRPEAPATGCCCRGCGYLPYMLVALRPLCEATLGGLALLAIVSVSFGPWGVFVHFLGATGFFYGSMALHFCYILSIRQLILLYPGQCEVVGFSLKRLYPHVYVLASKMVVTFFNEWFIFILGRAIERSGGTDKLTNFSYHYLAALDQVSQAVSPQPHPSRVRHMTMYRMHACTEYTLVVAFCLRPPIPLTGTQPAPTPLTWPQWFIVSCTLMVALLVAADVDALDAALAAETGSSASTSALGDGDQKASAGGFGDGTEMSTAGRNIPPAETALAVGTSDAGAETSI